MVFGLVGILVFGLCYRYVFRGGLLKLDLKHERFFEWLVTATWALSIPCLGAALGALLGGWWAGSFLIKHEKLGERVGRMAFRAIAAGVAASNLKDTGYTEAEMAEALFKGEQKLTIEQIKTYTSHHAGEVSAASIEALLPIDADGSVHHGTVWVVEKTLDTIAYYELNGEGDVVYKLAAKVAEHDRTTDNDGLVTVEEISDVACKAFLDKTVNKLWAAVMLELILPTLAIFLLIPLAPPILAWITRKGLGWWRNRKASEASE
jgi:hypothetical protein